KAHFFRFRALKRIREGRRRAHGFGGRTSEWGSGPIRERRVALRSGTRGLARPVVSHRPALFPVPYRAIGGRQDLAAAAAVSVAAADPRADHPVRPRRRDLVEGCCRNTAS